MTGLSEYKEVSNAHVDQQEAEVSVHQRRLLPLEVGEALANPILDLLHLELLVSKKSIVRT